MEKKRKPSTVFSKQETRETPPGIKPPPTPCALYTGAGTTCYPAEDGKNLAASQNIPASEHLSLIATLRSLIFGSWTSSANLITSIGRNQATKRNHFVRRTLLKKQKTPLCKETDYKPRIIWWMRPNRLYFFVAKLVVYVQFSPKSPFHHSISPSVCPVGLALCRQVPPPELEKWQNGVNIVAQCSPWLYWSSVCRWSWYESRGARETAWEG